MRVNISLSVFCFVRRRREVQSSAFFHCSRTVSYLCTHIMCMSHKCVWLTRVCYAVLCIFLHQTAHNSKSKPYRICVCRYMQLLLMAAYNIQVVPSFFFEAQAHSEASAFVIRLLFTLAKRSVDGWPTGQNCIQYLMYSDSDF